MGFMDKVVTKAQEVGKAGQAKVDEVQTKRRIDDLYREIGALTYAARSGRANADDSAKLDQAFAALGDLKVSHPELFGAEPTSSSGSWTSEEPPATAGQSGGPVSP